jgi:hypothetical protein
VELHALTCHGPRVTKAEVQHLVAVNVGDAVASGPLKEDGVRCVQAAHPLHRHTTCTRGTRVHAVFHRIRRAHASRVVW